MVRRRWVIFPLLAVGITLGWKLAHRRPFSARLAWFLGLPGVRSLARAEELAALLELQPGMQVLDAGAGPGRLTIPLAERLGPSGSITALDMQPRMLELVQQQVEKRGLTNVRLLLAELGRGTLATLEQESYDRVLLVHVLGETAHPAATLQELAAVLRPGGRLAIVETVGDPHYVRYRRVREQAERVGLRLIAERRWLLGHITIWEKPHQTGREKGAA